MDFTASHVAFGIDIGGTGIKGAPVDLNQGTLLRDRLRLPTPRPATPQAVTKVVGQIVDHFQVPSEATVGITFPGITQHGICRSAVNMDGDWIGRDLRQLFKDSTSIDSHVLNDADAAGYAECQYGAGVGVDGMVLTITLGTGIGSALVHQGHLVPNLELGHLEIEGHDIETRAAASVKVRENLSYEQWAGRLQTYFAHLEYLFSPDLFVIGGGISKDHRKFLPLLSTRAPMVPAVLFNHAGIVGAAAFAAHQS